jgi:hypothetical protein
MALSRVEQHDVGVRPIASAPFLGYIPMILAALVEMRPTKSLRL